jgi:hypothetical protein
MEDRVTRSALATQLRLRAQHYRELAEVGNTQAAQSRLRLADRMEKEADELDVDRG